MGRSCNAIVFTDREKVEIQEIDLPDIEPGEIGVKTLYSGISIGSELWILKGKFWNTTFPNVPGYQKVGIVELVGNSVTKYKQGDIVFLRTTKLASNIEVLWAGHTSFSIISADEPYMFKLPKAIAPESASLLCLPAVGYHGVAEVMDINKGDSVAVIGLGMIGQFSAQAAMLQGANVIALDIRDDRLTLAADHAKAITINPAKIDPESEIKKIYPDGLDVIIDTSSNAEIINKSFQWLKPKGKYCLQGYYPEKTSLDLLWPHIKELVIYNPIDSTSAGARHCARYIADGRMAVKEMISINVPFTKAPALYANLLSGTKTILGAVINWSDGI